jgi:hypothetical protein
MRAKSRRYQKPLSIKMTRATCIARWATRSSGKRVKPSARVYDRKRQPAGAGSVDWRSTT